MYFKQSYKIYHTFTLLNKTFDYYFTEQNNILRNNLTKQPPKYLTNKQQSQL